MIALGIDPGTRNIGLALVERDGRKWRLLVSPVLSSLDDALKAMQSLILDDAPSVVAAERVTWSTAIKTQGNKSADILRIVGAAQLFALIRDSQFIEVAPNTWRKCITGNGKASKEQVRRVLSMTVLDWPKRQPSLNRSDAVAIAIAGAMRSGAR